MSCRSITWKLGFVVWLTFFYCSAVDSSKRYVAEENVEIVSIEREVADRFPIEAGKYFKRWDEQRKAFISNIQSQYPED
jgi:F-box protein 21